MEWTPCRVPTKLYIQMAHIIKKHPELGYTNEHEFIRDALREKIASVKQMENNPEKEA